VNKSWFTARLRHAEGDAHGAARVLEDSLRVIVGDTEKPPPQVAMPFVTAAEWRLAAGDARGADSLALIGRSAAAVDSLALERSAYVGRAALVSARALAALGRMAEARSVADRAIVALASGYGATNQHTTAARAFRDSLPR
jgi:hypothetical protein